MTSVLNKLFRIASVAALAVLTFCCYFYVYNEYVVDVFGYYGFFSSDLSSETFVWVVFIYVTSVLLLRGGFSFPSQFFLFYMNILVLLPILVVYASGGISYFLPMIVMVSYILIVSLQRFASFVPSISLSPFYLSDRGVTIVLLMISIFTVLLVYSVKGINFNFDLDLIYQYREESSDKFSGIYAYLVKWLSFSAFPFLLIWGLFNKNPVLILISLLGQLVIFGYTNHKSYFFNIALVVSFFVMHKTMVSMKIKNQLAFYLFVFFTFSVLIAYITFEASSAVGSLWFRRLFFWPVLISDNYMTYASEFGSLFYSNDIPAADLVSFFMQRPGEYVNTGFVANAYFQLGWMGVLIFSLLLGILLVAYDRLFVNRLPIAILGCLCIITFRPVLASDFKVALISNGILFMFILQVLLFNKRSKIKYE